MRVFSSISTLAIACVVLSHPASAQSHPPRLIVFIGDGVGVSYWTAARMAAGSLAVDAFDVVGLVNTESSNSRVTDSGASATAYASAVRTYNGAIGVGPDSVPVQTVLELAKERGMATGLVATSSVTHATPAAFAAHVPSRRQQHEIARQMTLLQLDVLLGGGRDFFDARNRPDGLDLLGHLARNNSYIDSAERLRNLDHGSVDRLVGLFAEEQMPKAQERDPTLPEMTRAALNTLDRNHHGFFLMVEASQPDWRGHENASLEEIVAEMLDFDRAIGVGLEYQSQHPETLIVVLADHETGGLAVQFSSAAWLLRGAASSLDTANKRLHDAAPILSGSGASLIDSTLVLNARSSALLRSRADGIGGDSAISIARYTTGSHTPQLIPLFARGPDAERFGGITDNVRVGQLLLAFVRDRSQSVNMTQN